MTKNITPSSDFFGIDWSKVLREDIDIRTPQIVLAPGSSLDPALETATWTPGSSGYLTLSDTPENILLYQSFTNGVIYLIAWDNASSQWLLFNYNTFTVTLGPSSYDDMWKGTDPGTGEWSPGEIVSIGKLF